LSLKEIKKYALVLAQEAWDASPDVKAIYWFPNEHEVRLVETCRDMVISLSGYVEPFYWDSTEDVPFPTGVAAIRPEEIGKLELPEGWGGWEQGIKLESPKGGKRQMDQHKWKAKQLVARAKMMGLTPMFTHMHRMYFSEEGPPHKILGGTTCVLFNENMEPVGRGNSIVSKKDRPIRAVGRCVSLHRALEAYFKQETEGKVCTWEYFRSNFFYSSHFEECCGHIDGVFIPKCVSEQELELTKIEKKRLEIKRSRGR
jgi:hypothetical protein